MKKYLKINIEGCVQGCCIHPEYVELDYLTKYSEEDLLEIGQAAANEVHSWGHSVVDVSEVPEEWR